MEEFRFRAAQHYSTVSVPYRMFACLGGALSTRWQ